MPYLIDGHNLIPRVGLDLSEVEDEMALVELLKEFCRHNRKRVEVYFDRAPIGWPRQRRFGLVTAIFAPPGKTADQAIQRRLAQLGGEARNWTVVSSDRDVQAAARAWGARISSSQAFARLLRASPQGDSTEKGEIPLSPSELRQWMKLFEQE